ncbi:FAD-binding and (Fe-S)-binding domain-containing protein [Polyangium sp. y55x31]|uniref:FAD-binding and (Fe-S)-binding domain-containing protein n=1 Tax=Polyangium sp. y55x31 TaxID=3042688 RepID=UPI00248328E7|nr:FAD-binding and (Fe-S)-binding domain-containing protein [Polyangium sp. y55x31]MDI1480279.1 FAD-linked oxidase C-terminal domain-containing protein [Polyangium sp. y55x31]
MATLVPLRKNRDDHGSESKNEHAALEARLRATVGGEVRFDGGSRAIYSTDASNYRQVPIGVVVPRDADDVEATVTACREHGAPIVPRGGGTSLAGQTCNVAVVLDFSKYMNRVVEIDPEGRFARVQPGVALDDLRRQAEEHHLTFPPDPATHAWCTLGGMIGNDSCGIHSVMGGPHAARTADYVEELDVLTYEGDWLRLEKLGGDALEHVIRAGGPRGRIFAKLIALRNRYADRIRARYPDIPRRVSGYNLDELLPEKGFHVARALVGSEGTCAIVLEARVRLIPSPRERVLVVLGYPDVFTAADHVPEILEARPTGLEAIDRNLIDYLRRKHLRQEDVALLPEGQGFLLVELGGDVRREVQGRAHELAARITKGNGAPSVRIYERAEDAHKIWVIRESGLSATAHVPGMRESWPGWEDSAVAPEKVGSYLRELRGLLDRFGYECALYGHFGQGCVHCRIDFDLRTRPGIDKWLDFLNQAADLVVRYGGSISGEHGDGQARAALLGKMFGPELVQAFREFKSIWDPRGKMNPGKVVDPYPIDANLRLGAKYAPLAVQTHFQFPEDGGSFAEATLRCVGVGQCRRVDTGTMCPSYMVTREEKHTTRGRARLLFEMLNGDETPRGWDNADVKEALDLCLSCKGCKGECPVHVDMATYKAEFLSHYYERNLRPMSAHAMGRIRTWARLSSFVPSLVNAIFRIPVLGTLLKRLGGIATARDVPRFARRTFKRWFFARRTRPDGGKPVILWADTFNDHFHPEVAIAAVRVLEDAGHEVLVPRASVCCGRPLYDYGMLDRAKRALASILETLRPLIRAGIPVVGLEPSCVAVFRDELVSLFPHDEDARRLSAQTFLLSELLADEGYAPPRLERKALVHGHCHQKSVLRFDAAVSLLKNTGIDCEVLDSGCCGMAGSFGFEADHYDVSRAIGERALLPAVRKAEEDTLVVTDGFSCRQQIEHFTGRRSLHVAEVLEMAIRQKQEALVKAPRPELGKERPRARLLPAAAFAAAGVMLGLAWGSRALRV